MREIIQAIENHDTIIIHRHVRPDPDALGSQGGLGQIIRANYPEKQVYLVGEEDPSLHFLVRMDKVTDEQYQNALVIVCDTANRARISDQRYDLGKFLIKMDHHPNVDAYGEVVLVDTSMSSTSQLVYTFAKEHGFKLNDEAARLLFAGIVGDTGRFLFNNTTRSTYEVVADLITYDFSPQEMYDEMYATDIRGVRFGGYVLQNFTFTEEGIGFMKITKEIMDQFQISSNEASNSVGSLGNVAGIKAWVLFFEEPKKIRVRLRSKGLVINELAAKYNGGGHPLASGATVYAWEEADALVSDLRMLAKE